ncbi:MAG TPA: DUF1559 domain-containing protein [Pirellulaceae bacterium]|nr:DUF1559 domain-containing protein [Pirellulaceae bacterium]
MTSLALVQNARVPIRVLMILVGTVFVATAFFHISNPIEFMNAVLAYQIVFGNSAIVVAGIVPIAELIIGVWLIYGAASRMMSFLASVLTLIYVGAQASAIIRKLSIDCGCFGPLSHQVGLASICIPLAMFLCCAVCFRCQCRLGENTSAILAARKPFPAHVEGVRKGFSLVEVVTVIGIIGVLLMIFMPAVQSVRESTRKLVCLNHLRQLGIAAEQFNSAQGRFPNGHLGFARSLRIPNDFDESAWTDPSHSYYWRRTQHTSSLVLLLTYMDQDVYFDALPISMRQDLQIHDWPGDVPTVAAIASQRISAFFCPSDDLNVSPPDWMIVAVQPGWNSAAGLDGDGYMNYLMANDLRTSFAGTNYVGCSGAHSGGVDPISRLNGYAGVMTCRQRVRNNDISDGLSNTLLYGESLGHILSGQRKHASSWMFGAVARGRGDAPWGEVYSPETDSYFLGDHLGSPKSGFGSKHRQVVCFVKADGSTQPLSRAIALDVFYALCGRADAMIAASD